MCIEQDIQELKNQVSALTNRCKELEEVLIPKPVDKALTTTEAANQLGFVRDYLLELIRDGKVNAIKTRPDSKWSRYRVMQSEVDRLLKKELLK